MPAHNIVIGQHVKSTKIELAKQFRRQMTPAERTLWQRLRGGQLGGKRFRRQQIIAGYIVDFYCHAAALVVEVDGEVHTQQPEYDRERDSILAARGLRILRIRNQDISDNLRRVLKQIAAKLEQS